ncbi:C-reactive protein [Ctenodactylus gundi]
MRKLLWCFLVLISLSNAFGQKDLSEKAFVFLKASDNSYVSLKGQLTGPLNAFTVCLQIYTELFKTRDYSIFSYATEKNDNEILIYWYKDKRYSFSVGGSEIVFEAPEIPVLPVHVCASWESVSGIVEFWVDGKPMVRKSLQKGYLTGTKASIILGQEQDSFGGSFEKHQCFVGDIGDVNMWDYVLSPDEIRGVYAGGTFSPNVLVWQSLTYEEHGEVFSKPKLWS